MQGARRLCWQASVAVTTNNGIKLYGFGTVGTVLLGGISDIGGEWGRRSCCGGVRKVECFLYPIFTEAMFDFFLVFFYPIEAQKTCEHDQCAN